jgi:hypothetical protein
MPISRLTFGIVVCAKKVDDKTRAKIGEAETVDEVKAGSVWLEKQVSKDKKGDA